MSNLKRGRSPLRGVPGSLRASFFSHRDRVGGRSRGGVSPTMSRAPTFSLNLFLPFSVSLTFVLFPSLCCCCCYCCYCCCGSRKVDNHGARRVSVGFFGRDFLRPRSPSLYLSLFLTPSPAILIRHRYRRELGIRSLNESRGFLLAGHSIIGRGQAGFSSFSSGW